MSLGTGDPASETGEDSLSAITFDSDFETKTKRKSVHKPPPTSPKSPYYCKPRTAACGRPLRTAASMPLGSRTALTPQRLWLGSAKQGHAPGTPVYREKEDMYDEIMDLKKSLHMQRSDADLLRTKLRRLEEENSRKDRQIEQLLDPSRGPDFVWTLGEKRPDAGWVINGLKQRVLRLEQQCKDKDSTISKLQTDMKTTSLEEMRIVMETYYEEIHRLQTLLASSETPGRKPVVERKAGLRRQRKLSGALLSLSRSVQELTEENQSLKEDLDRVLSSSPTVARTKGCTEWSKPRLLRRIAELEKKISSMESPKPQASDVVRSDPLALSASSTWGHRQPCPEPQEDSERPQDSERQEDSERLRGALRSLKGERKALQAQLQERDLEVRQLLQAKADLEKELEELRRGEEARRAQEAALREEIQALTRRCQDLEGAKEEEEDDPTEGTPEAPEEPRPASGPCQQDPEPGPSEDSPGQPCACSEQRRHAAASTLQARWKVYRRQKRKAALDEAATVLQAAFRGHLARTRLLASPACGPGPPSVPSLPSQSPPSPRPPSPVVQAEGDPRQEAAVTLIQSVFRAHLARGRHSAGAPPAAASRTPAPATLSAPSPPAPAAAPAGQEDSEVSGGDAVEGPAPQPCPAEAPPSSAPWEDVDSDDSDQVVVAPALPAKRSTPLPPRPGSLRARRTRGHAVRGRLAQEEAAGGGPDPGRHLLSGKNRTALPRHLRLLVWLVCGRPSAFSSLWGRCSPLPGARFRRVVSGRTPGWPGREPGTKLVAPSVGAEPDLPPPRWLLGARLLGLPRGPPRRARARGPGKPGRCRMVLRRPPPTASLPAGPSGSSRRWAPREPLGPEGQALPQGAGRLRGIQACAPNPRGLATGRAGKGRKSPRPSVPWPPRTHPRRCLSTRRASVTLWAMTWPCSVQPACGPGPSDPATVPWRWPGPLPGARAGLGLGWDPGPASACCQTGPPTPGTQVGASAEAHGGKGQGQVKEQGLREPGGGASGGSKTEAPWGGWPGPRSRDLASVSARGPGAACRGEGWLWAISPQPLCITSPLTASTPVSPDPEPAVTSRHWPAELWGAPAHGPGAGDHPSGSRGTPLGARLAVPPGHP